MQKILTFNKIIKPYLAITLAIVVTALLVAEYFLNIKMAPELIMGLWGTLVITNFILIGQIILVTKKINESTKQLVTSKERLINEIKHRHWAEKTTSESRVRLQVVDENLPILFAYFNVSQRCRYHNQAYRKWFGLSSNQINGRFIQEFSSPEFCLTIKTCIKDILAGKIIFNELVQKSAKGSQYHLAEQIIPHFDNKRKVIGFYALYTPRIPNKSRVLTKHDVDKPTFLPPGDQATKIIAPKKNISTASGISAAHIVQAIEGGEFRLYCQSIIPVKSDSTLPMQHEILLRMTEEESNLLPPGAFLPFVEKYNLMPRLDCWVVEHTIKWIVKRETNEETICSVNVGKSTINNIGFQKFVQDQLQKTKIDPGLISFEIEEADVFSNLPASLLFTEEMRRLGCQVSLCSFNHSRAAFDLLKQMDINFIKIDGSLICNILRDNSELEKVTTINQVAHSHNIQTIAELVENEKVMDKLNEIGVDYAQGFSVATPWPIEAPEQLNNTH